MPFPVFVEKATLRFPANKQTPVDVDIVFKSGEKHQPRMSAGFNWLEETGEIWTIAIETGAGRQLKLEKGGTVLKIDGKTEVQNPSTEYEQIYSRFAKLLKKGKSEMDGAPLRLIADMFLLGARENVTEFHW
jgi:D-galactose 1-dehydrogenase